MFAVLIEIRSVNVAHMLIYGPNMFDMLHTCFIYVSLMFHSCFTYVSLMFSDVLDICSHILLTYVLTYVDSFM